MVTHKFTQDFTYST